MDDTMISVIVEEGNNNVGGLFVGVSGTTSV